MAPVAGNKRPRESDVNHTAAKKPKESVPDNDETLKDMHLEHSDAEAAKQSTSDAAPVVADDAVDDANPADAEPCVPTNNTPSPFALRPVNSNEPNIDDSQPENDDPSSPPQQVPTAGSMLPPPVIPGKSRGRGSDSTTSAAIAAVQASQAAAAAAAAAASAPTAPIDASSNPYLARYGEGQHPPPPPPGYIPMPFMPHHNPYLANQFPMYIPHTGHMMPIPIPFDQSQYRPPAGATPQGAATTQSGEGNTEAGQPTENTEGNNNENGNGAAASNAEGGTSNQQPPPIPHPFPHPPPGFPHHPFPTHMPPPEFLPNPNDPHNPHTHPHHTHLLPPMHHPHAPNTMQLTLPLAVADHALPSHLDALIRAPESLTITYSEVPDGAYLLRSDFGEPYPKQLEPPRKTTEMRCLFCKRHYSGPNARGMWRRHVTGKHDFVFERKGKDSLPGIVPRRGNAGEHDDDDDPPSPTGNGPNGDTPNPGQSNPTVTPGAPGAPGMGLVGPDGVMGLMSLNGMPIHATSGQPNPPGTPGTPGHPPPPPPHMMGMAYPYAVPFGHFPPGMIPPPPHFGPPVTIDAKKPRTSTGTGRGGRSPNGVGMGNGGGGLVPRVHPLLSKEERIERARASKRHYAMKRRALEKMKQGGIPKGARLVDGVFILADGTQIPAEPGRVYTDLNAPSASTGVHLAGTGSSGVVGDDGDDDDYGKKKKRRLSRRSSSKRRGKDDEDEDEDEEADELAVGEELQEGLISMEGGDADHWNMASNPSQAQGSGSVSVTDQSVQVGMSTTTTSVITQTPGSGKLAEVPIISRGFKPPPMTPHVMMPQQSPTAPVTVQTATTATATTTTTVVKRGGAVSGTTGRARGGRRKSAARIDDEMDADDQPPAASTEATGTDAQTANVEEGKGDASKDQAQEQSTEDAEPSVPTTTTTTRSGRTVKSSIQSTTPKRTTTRGGRGAKKDDSTAEDKEQDNKDKPTTTSNLPPGIIPPGEDDEEDERRFCYCGDVEYGQMIGCDNGPNCPREWFHLTCTDIKGDIPPRWFCKECRAQIESGQTDADTAESSVPAVVVSKGKEDKAADKDKEKDKDKEEKDAEDAEASAAIPTRGRPRRGRPPKSKAAEEEPAPAVTSTPPTSKRGGRPSKAAAPAATEKKEKEKEKEKEAPKGRRGRGRKKSTAQANPEAEPEDEAAPAEETEEEEKDQYESEDQGETVPAPPSKSAVSKDKDSIRRLDEDYDELDEMDVDMTGLVHVEQPAAGAAAPTSKATGKGKADAPPVSTSGGRSTRSSAKRGAGGPSMATSSPGKTRSGKPLSSASATAPVAASSNDMEVDELEG